MNGTGDMMESSGMNLIISTFGEDNYLITILGSRWGVKIKFSAFDAIGFK